MDVIARQNEFMQHHQWDVQFTLGKSSQSSGEQRGIGVMLVEFTQAISPHHIPVGKLGRRCSCRTVA